MDISIFEVTGPVMIGPSSSHTAGAARLARVARLIAGGPFDRVEFGLHGSFAKTYRGHGTDRALVAGALGIEEDDERLAQALELAEQQGLSYRFYPCELDGAHENSVRITFFMKDGNRCEVVGSSVGGAQIVIRSIDGFDTEFSAQASTLVVSQYDRRGVVSDLSRVLADSGINIAVMKLSRRARGDLACTVIETDGGIPAEVVDRLRRLDNIIGVRAIDLSTKNKEARRDV